MQLWEKRAATYIVAYAIRPIDILGNVRNHLPLSLHHFHPRPEKSVKAQENNAHVLLTWSTSFRNNCACFRYNRPLYLKKEQAPTWNCRDAIRDDIKGSRKLYYCRANPPISSSRYPDRSFSCINLCLIRLNDFNFGNRRQLATPVKSIVRVVYPTKRLKSVCL